MIELRDYQNEAVESVFEYFQSHGGTDENGVPIPANPLIALPTGTGKSLVIGAFLERVFRAYPRSRVLMLTHVKELISQNAAKLHEIWPLAPLGVNSAGLKSRDHLHPIIFGGVQSCVNHAAKLGFRDLLVIDEAHLVGDEGSYLKIIAGLKVLNPFLKVIGLTATPYRMGLGKITNGCIFTDVCYDLTNLTGFQRLLAAGHIAPLIAKATQTELSTEGVKINKGDYDQGALQEKVDKRDVNYAVLRETVAAGEHRKSGLIFASGVDHAEHLAEMLETTFRQSVVCIHSRKSDADNARSLAAWKAGDAKYAVNMNSLTTGIDHPALDLIAMARPTMSTGLWVQMLGRGTRPAPGKTDCLVLDFAGNTRKLGPINDPVIPRQRGEKGKPGDAPVRICSDCGVYNHASVRQCVGCGKEFSFDPKLYRTASTADVMTVEPPVFENVKVDRVVYVEHTAKSSGKKSIKICYYCQHKTYYDYKSVEAASFAGKVGRDWLRQVAPAGYDLSKASNSEIIALASALRVPDRIRVWVNTQFPRVMSVEF